ncbi:hypothetical protein BGZ60DRAFT_44234 [Tricladium varicosporioides]|nr:hypothetical protein BGZ60DRAFT_44234 [Hymenoscyphus varicosporioides]
MVFREDNMKFPPLMKLERMKPDVSVLRTSQSPGARSPSWETSQNKPSSLETFSLPPQLTVSADKHRSDSARDSSDSDSKDQTGVIIRTTDLLSMSQALQICPQVSPKSFDSYSSAFEDSYGQVSSGFPGESHDITVFPLLPGAIPIPTSAFRASADRSTEFYNQPQVPHSIRLAPDSNGKEIPSDAKWTKITRRLVTPEVFHQDGRRYEARPDFVAVLGVLSREEINNYAARSYALRAARSRPRVIPSPSSSPRTPRPRLHRQTSSSSSSDEDSPDSDDHRKNPRNNRGSRQSKSNTKPQRPASSTLPAPREPPPRHSPQESQREKPRWVPNLIQEGQGHSYRPPSERESGYSRRRHGDSTSSRSSRSKDRGSRKESEKISRWTAAGLGGAAASLLGVLSEAAEGL